MPNDFWRLWERQSVDNARPSNDSNSTSRVAILEDMWEAVLNCYEYFCNNGKKYGVLNETDHLTEKTNCRNCWCYVLETENNIC